jgi:hypothetical protein
VCRGDDEPIVDTLCNEAIPASYGNDCPVPFIVGSPRAFCSFLLQRRNWLSIVSCSFENSCIHFSVCSTVGTAHSSLTAPAIGWPVITEQLFVIRSGGECNGSHIVAGPSETAIGNR